MKCFQVRSMLLTFYTRLITLMSRIARTYCLTNISYLTEFFIIFILLHTRQYCACYRCRHFVISIIAQRGPLCVQRWVNPCLSFFSAFQVQEDPRRWYIHQQKPHLQSVWHLPVKKRNTIHITYDKTEKLNHDDTEKNIFKKGNKSSQNQNNKGSRGRTVQGQ